MTRLPENSSAQVATPEPSLRPETDDPVRVNTTPPRTLTTWLRIDHPVTARVIAAAWKHNAFHAGWLAPAVLILNAIYVIAFSLLPAEPEPDRELWRQSIVVIHIVAGHISVGLTWMSRDAARRPDSRVAAALGPCTAVAALAFTLALVTADQLVSGSTTAFFIATVISGTVVLLRPVATLIIYAVATIAYWILIAQTQKDPAILLSNQLYGLTASFLGGLLSFVWWRAHVVSENLREEIERKHEELEAKQRELTVLATRDALTGLYNRLEFTNLVATELSRAARRGAITSLILIDIDRFKAVNDKYGHPVGDAVLSHVARLLGASIRAYDVAARLGGEEFVILLPETSLEDARALAERLRAVVGGTPFMHGHTAVQVTISLGVSSQNAGDEGGFGPLYTMADQALYDAKRGGRDRVRTATQELESPATRK